MIIYLFGCDILPYYTNSVAVLKKTANSSISFKNNFLFKVLTYATNLNAFLCLSSLQTAKYNSMI